MTTRFRSRYGASPLHLLAHLALLPLAAWALLQIADSGSAQRIFAWLAASVILHDLVLLPFYGVLDRLARRTVGGAINYVRVPALISGLLLLVYYPAISGTSSANYERVSGIAYEGYLARWLLATAALFAISGGIYLAHGLGKGPDPEPNSQ
jgi:hypothetical protein